MINFHYSSRINFRTLRLKCLNIMCKKYIHMYTDFLVDIKHILVERFIHNLIKLIIKPPAYRARLHFANHEMVDKLLQQESLAPNYVPGECPMRYYERRINLLKRVVGLLLLALPHSLQELEGAAWDEDLENNFFRPGGIPVIAIILCLQVFVIILFIA